MKLNKIKKRALPLLLLAALTILLPACGSQPEEGFAYLAEKVEFGEFANVLSPVSFEGKVYFYCINSHAIHAIDMESETPEAEELLRDPGGDFIVSMLSPHPDGSLGLLLLKFDGEGFADAAIMKMSPDGSPPKTLPIIGDISGGYGWPAQFLADDDFFYLALGETVYVWDMGGILKHRIPAGSRILFMSFDHGGRLYAARPEPALGYDVIAPVDPEAGAIGPWHGIPGIASIGGMAPGLSGGLLLAADRRVYEYDPATNGKAELLSLNAAGVPGNLADGGTLLSLPGNQLGWLKENAAAGQADLWLLRPVPESEAAAELERIGRPSGEESRELAGREILTLCLFPWFSSDHPFTKAVSDFNESNPGYRIEIKEYEDQSQLDMAIITGNAPDIIYLPLSFSMAVYAKVGALADLYPLLDADGTAGREDLQENILKAYEVDGQLFGIPVSYSIQTVLASQAEVGGISSWTLDEMIGYADSHPPESHVFSNHSKSGVLRTCLEANGDALVDWDNGGVFDRSLFLKMIEFANRFTPDHLYAAANPFTQFQDKQVQIHNDSIFINNIGNINFYQMIFGGPVSYPGYPAEGGSGNLVYSSMVLAISHSSPNKEASWSFISSLLADGYQASSESMYEIPLKKSAFEALLNEVMESFDIEGGLTGMGFNWGNEHITIELDKPTEEDAQQLRDLINSATKTRSFDERINNILKEEAGSFFSGAKTADEAADIAANRIGIYVNELR
ncbi:MAG: extracellular solute-binding protein [Lachnospiraceae bacterium]|nr:extracellular solute-binding protein [Lachnospiraceae bacterium]